MNGSYGLVVHAPGKPALERRPAVVAGPGEAVVVPLVVGLCGTDLEIIDGRIDPAYVKYPLVLGHEWSGKISQSDRSDLPPGTLVVVEGIVPCRRCARCVAGDTNLCEVYREIGFTRDGAAAGEVVVPTELIHELDDGVHPEDGALVEPAAVVYRALCRSAPRPGSRALVIGDGTIAMLAVHLLRLWSPAEVVLSGRRPEQADLAAAAGADCFEVAGDAGDGYDLVVEAAGKNDAVVSALSSARRGGTVVLVGLPEHGSTAPVPVDLVVNNDLTVHGSFGYTSEAWRGVVSLLNAGRLRPRFLVTHRYDLADWEQAVTALRSAGGARGKVVLVLADAPS
ncbi:MAG: zinc-dependent alcohol dehydrogenase [Acidimicrobiales bacterium]